ncbi:MAG: outer membrane beta-barrel protein [Bryobacteraceae bacterium]
MKKSLALAGIGALLSVAAYAQQEGPKVDVTLSYSFVRYNSAQTIPAFTANGGIGTFGWNFNDHLALEAELGGYHNGNVNNYQFDTTTFSYLFGPRISWNKAGKINPYAHILFGGQHLATSITKDSLLVVNPRAAALSNDHYSTATNNFAMAVGGGVDYRLTRSITIRPAQIDYYLTRIEAINVTVPIGATAPSARNQNNFRYAAGIQFTYGGTR